MEEVQLARLPADRDALHLNRLLLDEERAAEVDETLADLELHPAERLLAGRDRRQGVVRDPPTHVVGQLLVGLALQVDERRPAGLWGRGGEAGGGDPGGRHGSEESRHGKSSDDRTAGTTTARLSADRGFWR